MGFIKISHERGNILCYLQQQLTLKKHAKL